MAVPYPFTSEAELVSLAGQQALDLRLDDSIDAADDLEYAIDSGTDDTIFYLQDRYSVSLASLNTWVRKCATWFALRSLCQRRLNDVPQSVTDECTRREKQLQMILERKAVVPGLANTRRPVAVSTYTVNLRKYNNTIETVPSKSTGIAEGYTRPIDETAPDDR